MFSYYTTYFRSTSGTCTTKPNHKHWCPGLHMDAGATEGGGCEGGETITWDDVMGRDNFYYLVFVEDVSNQLIHSLTTSWVRLVLYGDTIGQVARFTCPAKDPHTRSRFYFVILFFFTSFPGTGYWATLMELLASHRLLLSIYY